MLCLEIRILTIINTLRHQLQSGYTVLLDGEKICF